MPLITEIQPFIIHVQKKYIRIEAMYIFPYFLQYVEKNLFLIWI